MHHLNSGLDAKGAQQRYFLEAEGIDHAVDRVDVHVEVVVRERLVLDLGVDLTNQPRPLFTETT
jgi:hypothetical protein